MLAHPTGDKLHQLRCAGMAKALAEQLGSPEVDALSFEERLGLIVDREFTERASRQLSNRLRRARLRHAACMEDIDFRQPRGLDRDLVLSLAAAEGFDALVTVDRGIEHQQNLATLSIPVIVMLAPRNRLAELQPLVPFVTSLLSDRLENRIYRVPD